MSSPVVTVAVDDTLGEARTLLNQYGIHHLLVMDGSKVAGVLSDRDILRASSPFLDQLSERRQDMHTLRRPVHQVMSRSLVVTAPEESILTAASRMLDAKISCLPVVASGQLVGIVSSRDLLRALCALLDAKPDGDDA